MNPSDDLVALVWSQLWQVTVLIAVVGLVVRFGCRHRPHLAHVLWLVVFVKCLTPPLVSSATGVFSWAQFRGQAVETPGVSVAPQELMPFSDAPLSDAFKLPAVDSPAPTAAAPRRSAITPTLVVGAVWLLGLLVLCGLALCEWLHCCRTLKRTAVQGGKALEATLEAVARRLGLRPQVRLAVVSARLGPAVFGFLRPTVVVPEAVLRGKTREQIEPILAHELVHLRRGDALYGVSHFAAQAVWWFHPLVWWANRQACRACERCCDEEVVAGLGCPPKTYARCLLEVLDTKHALRPIFAFPGVRPFHVTSQRLEDITRRSRAFHRRTPRWCWGVAAAVAITTLPGAALTWRAARAAPDRTSETGETAIAPVGDAPTSTAQTAQTAQDPPPKVNQTNQQNDLDELFKPASDAEKTAIAMLTSFGAQIKTTPGGQAITLRAGLQDDSILSDEDLVHFEPLEMLGLLALNAKKITDAGMAHLRGQTHLVALYFNHGQFTDVGMSNLKDMTHLKDLLIWDTKITDAGLVYLKGMTELEELRLQENTISGERLVHLKGLAKLRQVELDTRAMTDAGMEHVRDVRGELSLGLRDSHVTDQGLKHLKGLTNVVHLGLNNTKTTDGGLQHLAGLSNLKTLDLSGTQVTGTGLEHLKGHATLWALRLNQTKIDDDALKHLAALPALTSLELKNTPITDAGLAHLASLTHLTFVSLDGTKVTPDGVKQLKQALPKCNVVFEAAP